MSIVENIEEQLRAEELEENWREAIESSVPDEDEHDALMEWIRSFRDEFLDYMDVVQDPEEIEDALVDRYIEIKSRWKMLNTKMQYQAVNTGQPDPALMVKGSLLSKLLERMENVLGGDEVADLTDFISEPMEYLSADLVEEEKLDEFMDFVGELIVTGEMYQHLENSMEQEDVSEDFAQNLQSTNQTFQELSGDLRESLMSIREISMENHLRKYPVMVRRMTDLDDREIDMTLEGEDTLVDKKLIQRLEEPLTEFIHNAVVHGIEPPEKREENDKDEEGEIRLSVSRSDDEIEIVIEDDGRGIDPDTVRNRLVEGGRESQDRVESMDHSQLMAQFLQEDNRGVLRSGDYPDRENGLVAAIQEIEDLRGTVEIESEPGEGTTFSLVLPRNQSVVVVEGLQVRAGTQEFIVPLESVIESISMDKVQTTYVEDSQKAINLRGDIFPLFELRNVLGISARSEPDNNSSIVMLLEDKGEQYGLLVDEILGQQKVVVRELGPVFRNVEYTSGSAVIGDGTISLVLDVEGLFETIESSDQELESATPVG
jgi:two-component system chemotaxis sensor kinase CheA